MKFSSSEENYIKAIYHLQRSSGAVSSTMLAGAVNTTAASVTDMLKKLNLKKLINYKPYKDFTLTSTGNKVALEVIRKHRLWEYFLVHKLGFEWDKVHDIAEELEHISSKELVLKLDEYLGNPEFDPHGDPIPDKNGKIITRKQLSLNELDVRKTYTVSAIKDQGSSMLELLDYYKVKIGTRIRLNKVFEYDGSVEIKIEKEPVTILSTEVAKNIYCFI